MVVVNGDAAVVVVDDAVDDGQAQARAAAFGGKVWEEEFLLVRVGDASAGIGDFDDDAVRRPAGGDAYFAGLRRFDRVLQQVADGPADLFGIDQDFDVVLHHDADRDARLHVAIQPGRLLQDLGELR